MNIKEWIAENIGYRFFGCCYNYLNPNKLLFSLIKSKIPDDFIGKEISDLGCGDGTNTLKIRRVFKPKDMVGYDHNDYLLERAIKKKLKVKKLDLNKKIPKGEMATFMFTLHHLKDKEGALRKVVKNFKYIFLCEPIKDLYHALLDGGKALPKQEWVDLFDGALKKYELYQYKSSLIVFYTDSSGKARASS